MKSNNPQQPKTVWLDLLCWESVIRVLILSMRHRITRVYYFNSHHDGLALLYRTALKERLGCSVSQITDTCLGEERFQGRSLYERAQVQAIELLDLWVSHADVSERIVGFCRKFGYEPVKFKEHLKKHAYAHVYRPIEMKVIAVKEASLENALFVLRGSPFRRFMKSVFGKERVFYYTSWFSHRMPVATRRYYLYDTFFNKKYYFDRISSIGRVVFIFLQMAGCSLWDRWGRRRRKDSRPNDVPKACIGVELLQSRVRLDEINDFFWLKDSGIDPASIWAIEQEELDPTSKDILSRMGVRRCRVVRRFFQMTEEGEEDLRTVTVEWRDWLRTLPHLLRLLPALAFWSQTGWLRGQQSFYAMSSIFWESVCRQLNVKLFMTMHDFEPELLPKSQAMENLGGLYVTGHWSNFPEQSIECQKCADVLFTWGPHSLSYNFNHFPYKEVFQTGYPCDFYFGKYRERAAALRKKYPGKFILSYHDNVTFHDIPFSRNDQIRIYRMLFDLLEKYPQFVVFLKPKRRHTYVDLLKDLPEIPRYLEQGRLALFLGETRRTKAVPAEIGMASDLVVGLSISTAASECFFAGIPSLHLDVTGFTRNAFAFRGRGTLVFRDIPELQKAIEDRIQGVHPGGLEDLRPAYRMLDPFQDGRAYRRTGFVLRQLQKAFEAGLGPAAALEYTRGRYDLFMKQFFKVPSPPVIPQKKEVAV